MIEIPESGVIFGPFNEDYLYQIEKSTNLPRNAQLVEFIWLVPDRNALLLVEAKSSFSQPVNDVDFSKNINEIYNKLVDSLIILVSSHLRRLETIHNELPQPFKNIDWSSISIHLRLVIPTFQTDWLAPISDKLREKLKHILAAFGISAQNVMVLNKELADKQGLLVRT
ncbi:hypothetical protein [Marinomonas sp. IMCC 4694]|uniref:hypothetical protein n=1 Tax=Marinomonas sp. IMCC 4694 TaxID=2605432 RepID=UPI0011E8597C|nr:hypothetical protein [Marinomonas sp. IMCC 4694]TYL46649.1 hypothetical protein FXV75_01080 [Marinomonas sp. IMCC 4694]